MRDSGIHFLRTQLRVVSDVTTPDAIGKTRVLAEGVVKIDVSE